MIIEIVDLLTPCSNASTLPGTPAAKRSRIICAIWWFSLMHMVPHVDPMQVQRQQCRLGPSMMLLKVEVLGGKWEAVNRMSARLFLAALAAFQSQMLFPSRRAD